MNFTQFIENWLDAIPNSSPVNFTQDPRPSLYHSSHSKVGKIPKPYWIQMTPPASYQGNPDRESSPKRKRYESPESDAQNNGELFNDDEERTPRSTTTSAPVYSHQQHIPFRLTNIPSIPPSESSHTSNQSPSPGVSDASQSKRGRPKSPVKSHNSLLALKVPVHFRKMRINTMAMLPPDVHELFRKIQDVSDMEGVIPCEVSQAIKSLSDRAKDRWFYRQSNVSTPESSSIGLRQMSPAAELDLLREIEADAEQCDLRNCSEASWNMWVHMPLLKYALSGHPTIRVEPSMSAKIATPFVPTTGGRGGGSVIESKMVDFSLLLWLNKGSPQLEPDDMPPEADARLMAAIANKVWAQPRDCQSVNQSMYPPMQFAPIACNIETKTSTSSNQGKLQLSVWTTAWLLRVAKLFPTASTMPTIPLLHVVGHDWKISFAYLHGDHVEIVGEHKIGDTSTLLGLYQLVASLRSLADWIATTYRRWAEQVFLEEV
ncbi:hypothetical protein BHE90_017486 [Fusarium euwallaceae]|uniref:PD-(D/E)XK nuclease-like domain-containing protein n=2 Tax=Fusarium solani species complex TaxID=232080 RepID=A0A430KXA1_9HYPO|nr:hypothetical protein CDV31_016826 [Fusarium ambrosium]RTE68137.1 hypothetical protein BHE90_017486 [Fusarium euwallaceae]